MKIRKTINGSNGAKFISTYKPFKVIIEDGITTVYLTKEDAILLKNDIKFKTSWWNAPYKMESEGKMLVCSACGLDVHSDYKTCPRCGAKMESEYKE